MFKDHLAWLLAGDLGRDKLALLVLCMLAISVLSAHVSWRLRRPASGQRRIRERIWVARWLVACLQVFFCVGIPLGVLARGALVREMGLPVTLVGPASSSFEDAPFAWPWLVRGLAWLELADAQGLVRLGTGLALGVGALAVLGAVWLWYARAVLAPANLALAMRPLVPWWDALRQAILAQFLWAVYRGFALLVIPDRTQAALFALALISIPGALSPRHSHDLLSMRGYLIVQEWLIALFTVLISITINQLWLLIVLHALWVWGSGRLLTHLVERSSREATATPAV